MYFSDKDLEELRRRHRQVAWKCQRIVESYLTRNYKYSRAREYAWHGFSRRLKMLVRCIDNVFRILPPDRAELPTNDELSDATINIQAFVFNVFGSIDNLAWIWVRETDLTKEDGSPVPNSWVGLSKNNTFVRGSLSTEFQEYLTELNDWFDHLDNFRHALAHRIPLYIPPYVVPKDKEAAHQQLGDRIAEAFRRSDFVEKERLESEQEALAIFIPRMTHSFEEESAFIEFHPQLLTDILTIEGLAENMLEELDP